MTSLRFWAGRATGALAEDGLCPLRYGSAAVGARGQTILAFLLVTAL